MINQPVSAGCCCAPVAAANTATSACTVVTDGGINTLEYNPALCINCGMCSTVCPHAVFAPDDHVARLVRPEACMECGACQLNCPTGAIAVDSGVGCAAAMIRAALTGRKEPICGPDFDACGSEPEAGCCC